MEEAIFSGPNSRRLWKKINKARKKRHLRWALYSTCCSLQKLETRLEKLDERLPLITPEPIYVTKTYPLYSPTANKEIVSPTSVKNCP